MSQQQRRPPLTDPAELINLIGRFFLAQVLNVLILMSLFRRMWVGVILLTLASLFVHRTTIVLWKRLRDERLAAIEAREKERAHG